MLPAIRSREVKVSDANETGNWDGILAPDEIMEWQGAPVQDFFWELPWWQTAGLLSLGPVAGLLNLAGQSVPAQGAAVFFVWGLLYMVWWHARSLWDRRRTFYSLTNRRAFIGTSHLGVMRLQAWPLADLDGIRLDDRVPGHVHLTTEKLVRPRRDRWREETVEIGFMNLTDPRPVHDLLMRLRKAPKTETTA